MKITFRKRVYDEIRTVDEFLDYIIKNNFIHNFKLPTKNFIKLLKKILNDKDTISKWNLKILVEKYFYGYRIMHEKYWLIRGWKDNEAKINVKKHQGSTSLKRYIEKFGEKIGKENYVKRIKTLSLSHSKDYKMKKMNLTDDEYIEYCKKIHSVTEEKFIKNFGIIDGQEKYNIWKNNIKNTYDNFIKRYGNLDGLEKWNIYIDRLKNRFSIDTYISKYGKQEGIDRFNKMCYNRHIFYSIVSQELFWNLYNGCSSDIQKHIYFAENNKEFGCWDNLTNRYYSYDFVITQIKLCIEFHGDIFHANPKIFDELSKPNPFNKNLTSKEIWIFDENKKNIIEKLGYDVIIVWESNYIKDSLYETKRCLNEINRRIINV